VVNRPQITTDALKAYADAVEVAFGTDVDYVMMNKQKGTYPVTIGNPDMTQVTTNHVERLNLTLRTQLRRHTRRTSGHSKKLAHHQAAIDLLIAYYNFCRVHEGLCVTPAMEFGLTRSIWSVAELMQAAEATPHDLEPVVAPAYPRPGRKPFTLRVLRGGKMR
jgi:IS1 family transposase